MTLQEIKISDKDLLTPAEIAPVLHLDPSTIRYWAHEAPEKLGFPVIVAGTRTKIPRLPFIRFLEGT